MDVRNKALAVIIRRAADVFKVDPATLSAGTSFETDLQAKSANYVQITTVLEDEFDVEIPYMEFKRKKTFGEAASYVEQLVEG